LRSKPCFCAFPDSLSFVKGTVEYPLTISPLHDRAVAMRDALYDANWRLDVKTAARAYRDTANVSSRFLACRTMPDAVPGLES